MKGKSGWAERILDAGVLTDRYQTSREVSEAMDAPSQTIRNALETLHSNGLVAKYIDQDGALLWKLARVHWIWSTPISRNPPKCLGERIWL